MKLLVNELKTELVQQLSGDETRIVEAVRLKLYKHNSPAGSLFVEVRDENGGVISVSESIAISSLSESAFFHGQIRFYLNAYLKAGRSYQLALCSTGYSFSESAYVGWCLDFDFHTYTKTTKHRHDFEIWSRK